MLMALNQQLPIPSIPYENGKGERWPLIDGKYAFPQDYIALITQYGSGVIADFITLFNPFSKNEYIDFFQQKVWILEDFNSLINDDPDYYTFVLYPKGNGLLPIGITDNGDTLFWVVSSNDSNLWTMAIIPSRSSEVEFIAENLTGFLDGVLSKRIRCQSFPTGFPSENITFISNC
ncbi:MULTISPECIES: SMI1/KNR4 family protein [Enterobacterales]|uniref:SMI1/KNR4 family protein n=1 Tax=Enterobacterales TaxID=91347 RepID=UPI000AE93614|nr:MULTISPECIES: SMI1/KNR4 family protein [Enterobacterales]MCK9782427.1 SMI1/KNR4 family protein [Proteus columbae]MCT6519038.1 SMI1/KNR4 family protein [Proteus vulgaris]WOO50322.1 SMI1/KNR4 family protein [Hafnia alvei]WPF04788.1 SMI1/KNR4 family protein [Proteus vulgaris]